MIGRDYHFEINIPYCIANFYKCKPATLYENYLNQKAGGVSPAGGHAGSGSGKTWRAGWMGRDILHLVPRFSYLGKDAERLARGERP
jgi:hypothetical protein